MRSLSFLFLALAACPTPTPEEKPPEEKPPEEADPARFGEASPEELLGAVQTALGFGPVWATLVQMQADNDARSVDDDNQPSGCPARTVLAEAPLTVRYEASGCTGPSGAWWDGLLEVENPLTWEDAVEDRAGATTLVADGFTMGSGAAAFRFDGTWSQSETAVGADATSTIDLAATIGGQTWLLEGEMDLGWEGELARTTCVEGLRGEVSGLGAFDVACDIVDLGGEASDGFVELHGEDILRVALTPDAEGCLPATIDGVAIEPLCLGDDGGGGGGSMDSDVFGGTGVGAVDDLVFLDAQTVIGEVAHVEIALSTGGAVEVHPLAADPLWGDETFDGWSARLEVGGYEAGVSTTFSYADVDALVGVYFAYDGAGEVVGCLVNGMGELPATIDVSACPMR